MHFLKRITRKPPSRSVEPIVILYVFSAIFNRVATGFILCISEHFRVRRGLGWYLNKLKTLLFPPWAETEGLGVCITNALLARILYSDFSISSLVLTCTLWYNFTELIFQFLTTKKYIDSSYLYE